VEKQKQEIISESQAQRLASQGKGLHVGYKTYVEIDDKIMVDYYNENTKPDLVKPVSGINQDLANQPEKGGGFSTSSPSQD
jgi:hypothetical protein